MLCSMCKKNTAVIFINKQGADGKAEVEGLCYECAKKKNKSNRYNGKTS